MNKLNELIKKIGRNTLVAYVCVAMVVVLGATIFIRPMILEAFYGDTVSVAAAKKKLPIYCVETPEKKVAISFDAAWGEGR